MTDEEKMTLRKMKARATVMDIEMKRRRHPPTLKVTGCPENEYNGTYSQHGETVNGAPVYESLHKDRSNKGVFLIYKANDGQSGHQWIITRNRDDISKDAGSYRSLSSAISPHRVLMWERLRFGMMGVTSRWEKCSELHVAEGKLIVSLYKFKCQNIVCLMNMFFFGFSNTKRTR
jgi:hypothetical protein